MPSNDMLEPHGLSPKDFESIREAVMETPRGRWFLNEYASRLRSGETSGLIDSMKRLENAMAASHSELMARLGQALENSGAPRLSGPQADLAPKHMKYFKQDEEIFEPAPQAKIAVVPDAPKPAPKPEAAKGAKVVIRRAPEAAQPAAAEPETEAVEMKAPEPVAPPPVEAFDASSLSLAVMPEQAAPSSASDHQRKRRIVIIRHQPGEDISVPLQNEMLNTG